jgi:hypothetical protein
MTSKFDEPLGIVFSDCCTCKHLVGGKCPAFPDDIPPEIWKARERHREVRPDQTGELVYSKRPD